MTLFNLEHVNYFYPDRSQAAIRDLSLSIHEGEFILVLGPSGSGKSTFAKLLCGLVPSFYGGKLNGQVTFRNSALTPDHFSRGDISMLFQNPERQIVTDRVEREIVYGMENLGLPRDGMRRRFSEIVQYLNLHSLIHKSTHSLSGGEKQKVVLASILAMSSKVLILDEPTSQLDPIAAEEVLLLLKRLHQDFGYTIILVEHRNDECFQLAERILFFDQGELKKDLALPDFLRSVDSDSRVYLPKISQVFHAWGMERIPVSVSEGQRLLKSMILEPLPQENSEQKEIKENSASFIFENVCFQYPTEKPVFDKLNVTFPKKKATAILGANGAGKSTLLKLGAGIVSPTFGKIRCEATRSKIGYVGQQPDDYLFHDRVYDECAFTLKNYGILNEALIFEVLKELGMDTYAERNPRDLSFSERLRVTIASILVLEPEIIFLDEPVRGLDAKLKQIWGEMFQKWVNEKNRTVVFVTQDVDFAAEFSDHLILMNHGQIIAQGTTQSILEKGLFFTPHVQRLFTHTTRSVMSVSQAIQILKNNLLSPTTTLGDDRSL